MYDKPFGRMLFASSFRCVRAFGAEVILQGKLPGFRDKILAEAMMSFFLHHAKPSLLVNVPRRIEFALRPQHHLFVSCLPRESHALTHQPGTNA
jgi:hypothetical protein